MNTQLLKQIELIIDDEQMMLYDILSLRENENNILRIIVMPKTKIDNDGNLIGVDIDKCAKISRLISPLLDVEEDAIKELFGYDEYILEVSSPGIERKLKQTKHYKASIGEMLKIKDFNGNIIKGKLIQANEEEIILETNHGNEIVSYDEISSAKTYFQWHKNNKK